MPVEEFGLLYDDGRGDEWFCMDWYPVVRVGKRDNDKVRFSVYGNTRDAGALTTLAMICLA